MSSEGSAPPPIPTRPKKKPPILLFILLPILAVALGMLYVDRQARGAAEAANEKLQKALDEEVVTPADVRKLLDAEPDGDPEEYQGNMVEKYSWRGAIKSYALYAVFSKGESPALLTVTLNRHPSEPEK